MQKLLEAEAEGENAVIYPCARAKSIAPIPAPDPQRPDPQ